LYVIYGCAVLRKLLVAHSFLAVQFESFSIINLCHQANDRTNRWSFLNLSQIPRNSMEISQFHRKGQILWLSVNLWQTVIIVII